MEQLEDITLVFSTLWSHISPAAEWAISRYVADYRAITHNGGRFLPLHSNQLHQGCLQFIETAVAAATSKVLVATHHIPTFLNYPAKYKASVVNEAFATELYKFIDKTIIDAWIFGHHHVNTPEFRVGNTRMLTNQLGYVKQGENRGYRQDAVVTL